MFENCDILYIKFDFTILYEIKMKKHVENLLYIYIRMYNALYSSDPMGTLMCLSIGTPKNNKFSICSKWKIHYFQVSQILGIVQPHYNVLEY